MGLARLSIFGFVVVSGALKYSHRREIGGTVGGLGHASIAAA
ncbi:hypothetical protein [Streptomyces xantholiticus]|uniref:Uncharacterized protein n=1 Tax=Streptomyces xantholiticus TaxID=68285 RepID=A0ABV1V4R5_9ACTN